MCSEKTQALLAVFDRSNEIIDRLFDQVEAAIENDDEEAFHRATRWIGVYFGWELDATAPSLFGPTPSLN